MRKKLFRRLLSLFLAFCMIAGLQYNSPNKAKAVTEIYTSGDYSYVLDEDGNSTLTAYNGDGGNVVIPDSVDGHSVIAIGKYLFNKCKSLTSIKIPETVVSIGHDAFAYTSLTELELPSKLKYLGYSIIYGVKGITSITIPDTVETMYANSNDGPFAGSSIKKAVFEEGIKNIPSRAFSNCSTLEEVKIPTGVEEIGSYAFKLCNQLTSIKIPETVVSIGHDAFAYTSLTELELSCCQCKHFRGDNWYKYESVLGV